jgi:fumarylacetoacetate (FAA) hydrolase
MRLVTFVPPDGQPRAGVLVGGAVIDLAAAAPLVLGEDIDLRWDMLSLLRGDQESVSLDSAAEIAAAAVDALEVDDTHGTSAGDGNGRHDQGATSTISIGGVEMLLPLEQVRLLAPLPRPASLRLFEAFSGYDLPVFAFGNHGAIYGPDADVPLPSFGGDTLAVELEVACVIGREGRDIDPDETASYIAGYTIVNDWIDTATQQEAIWAGLTTARAADFATSLGAWLVTPDELELYTEDDGRMSLALVVRVNQVDQWRGNLFVMNYSFAELVAYASRSVTLYPGDVVSSGVAHIGVPIEVRRGDEVELDVTGLGVLRNRVV